MPSKKGVRKPRRKYAWEINEKDGKLTIGIDRPISLPPQIHYQGQMWEMTGYGYNLSDGYHYKTYQRAE